MPKNEKKNPDVATAPYNFISLPEKILPSPLDSENLHAAIKDGKKKDIRAIYGSYLDDTASVFDGHIDLSMETLTNLFIGGGNGANTYAPMNQPIIPGSTIRGMVKNLFKMVTLGAMRPNEDFQNKRHLYYRCIMPGKYSWSVALNEEYKSRLVAEDGTSKTRPSFIAKTRNAFYIYPMKPGRHPERVLIADYNTIREQDGKKPVGLRESRVEWRDASAYVISGSQKSEDLFSSKTDYDNFMATEDDEAKRSVGKQFVKKFSLADVDFSNKARIPVRDNVIREYREDKNRGSADLLNTYSGAKKTKDLRRIFRNVQLPKDVDQIAPCYYLPDGNGNVTAFGHGECFRIPYLHAIADAVPEDVKKATIDFSDAVFGKMLLGKKGGSLWASRVFFEDAHPEGQVGYDDSHRAHPLASPNPTSYQLYLKQTDKNNLRHWDSPGACIRGYKVYWHNPKKDAWQASQNEIDGIDKDPRGNWKDPKRQLTREIIPIKPGARFQARIRFSRLRAEEIGALLMVFDMAGAKNIAYKMGKGKGIGLGSVRVNTVKLFVNIEAEYKNLFTEENMWNDPCVNTDVKPFLKAFEDYVGGLHMTETWQHVMGEVAAMLEWKDEWSNEDTAKKWSDKIKEMRTKYDRVNGRMKASFPQGFQRRDVLQEAEEVLKGTETTP